MIEDLSILLNFRIERSKLILRLDSNGLRNFEQSEQSVCELILNEFVNQNNLSDNFRELIGEVFEYETYSENDKSFLEFWGDYGRIENVIECNSIEDKNSNYTTEDLCHKGKILADSYSTSTLYEKFIQIESINTATRNKLRTELKNEIERFSRKAKFFQDKDKGKSEAFYSQKLFGNSDLVANGDKHYSPARIAGTGGKQFNAR